MPDPNSLMVTIRYNGYEHKCRGILGNCSESTEAHILTKHLPRGYTAEHLSDQFDIIFKTHCLVPDSSGDCQWVATEVLDLDSFAKGGEM